MFTIIDRDIISWDQGCEAAEVMENILIASCNSWFKTVNILALHSLGFKPSTLEEL